jgi:hypothetical protein
MHRHPALRHAVRRHDLAVEPGDDGRQVELLDAEAAEQVVVRVRRSAQLQPGQRGRPPRSRDATEEQLAVPPLAGDVAVLRAAGDRAVAPAGEQRVVLEAVVDREARGGDHRPRTQREAEHTAGMDA